MTNPAAECTWLLCVSMKRISSLRMNALMDFNSKHKHEATPGRWKSASKVFQGVAVDIVIYEQMNWSPMVFHQSRV
jgi:hypothetical protein